MDMRSSSQSKRSTLAKLTETKGTNLPLRMIRRQGETRRLADPQVFRRRLALVRDFVIAHLGTLIEAAKARSFDGRDMDENVLAAVVRLNEAVALGRVEPLHCTHRHVEFSINRKHSNTLTQCEQKESPSVNRRARLYGL
jgi:hypothetical protein